MSSKRQYSSPACWAHAAYASREPSPRLASQRIRIKRIYDPPARGDGFRVLVDRLWPRGIRKDGAAIDAWARELAPSTQLRKWFGHQASRWKEFRTRYRAELRGRESDLEGLRHRAAKRPVTLLYGARDPEHNHARVLKELLER